jgi:hypothetical protein
MNFISLWREFRHLNPENNEWIEKEGISNK